MKDKIKDLTARIGTTLDRFIDREEHKYPGATGELTRVLRDINLAAKIIHREINRAGLIGLGGPAGEENIQGESQQTLDVVADVRFVRALRTGGMVCGIVSEENEAIIDTGNHLGKYIVAMDPLDGSSNIAVNVPVGTIFCIYQRLSDTGTPAVAEDALQPGKKQIAAGYVLYGSSSMLVYTTGDGVNGFTYDQSLGEFYLSHPKMQYPEGGNTYSINESHFFDMTEGIQNYLGYCKEKGYTSRYIGSMVADFHRNLLTGGIYIYPVVKKYPEGKLRLLYECNPLAFISEQAGGMAGDGKQRILDIQPSGLHERRPIFIGSKKMVEEALGFLR